MDEVEEEVDEDEAAAEENVDEDEAAAEGVEDAKAGGQQTIVLHEDTQFPPGFWLSFCRFCLPLESCFSRYSRQP